MRISGNIRVGNAGGRGTSRNSSSSAVFNVDEGSAAPRAAATATTAPPAGIDALLALQAAQDPLLKSRKLVRRGNALLDTLQEIAADLLVGRVSEGRLNQLLALIGQARERAEPELDALLDDIELRGRVELAKRGLFPRP